MGSMFELVEESLAPPRPRETMEASFIVPFDGGAGGSEVSKSLLLKDTPDETDLERFGACESSGSEEKKESWELFDLGDCQSSTQHPESDGECPRMSAFSPSGSSGLAGSSSSAPGSPEEKVMRRKMKNRESARRSNERKKGYVHHLELSMRFLEEEHEELTVHFERQFEMLQSMACRATGKNRELLLHALKKMETL